MLIFCLKNNKIFNIYSLKDHFRKNRISLFYIRKEYKNINKTK